MTEREKLAASGLAVTPGQTWEASISDHIDWSAPFNFHARAGNGNQLQNAGVVLLAALATLQLKDGLEDLLKLEPASVPDGLTESPDGMFHLEVGYRKFEVGKDKKLALNMHKIFHESRMMTSLLSAQGSCFCLHTNMNIYI